MAVVVAEVVADVAIAEIDDPSAACRIRPCPIPGCLRIGKPSAINGRDDTFDNQPHQLIFAWQAPVVTGGGWPGKTDTQRERQKVNYYANCLI